MRHSKRDACPDLSLFRWAAAGLAVCGLALTACEPIDQRSFDASAGLPPVPPRKPVPSAPPPAPPFLQIVSGTPDAEWRPVVTKATRLALARKPNVLFILTAIVPRTTSPAREADELAALSKGEELAVARAIVAAGAPAWQVEMQGRAEGQAATSSIRVDVR
ncbi:hypothetical protein [Acidomonas methanolica]|uniref:hypothetical protein n=1 Tax=Acidomonas methanolica TaxID=437 RepID=UPI002119DB73|nr:hypothetical protein [Acidomonas methanolica]MCQ9154641.1 hypothetical protein [Acidomonas methanolica]